MVLLPAVKLNIGKMAASAMKYRENPVDQGACNLLVNCAGLRAGDRLLIVHEPASLEYYAAEVVAATTRSARRVGAAVRLLEVPFDPEPGSLPPGLAKAMAEVDQTVFFARIGDQMRFRDLIGGGRATVAYTLDGGMLGSGFGTAQYRAFDLLAQAADRMFSGATEIRLTCPHGTDMRGAARPNGTPPADVSVRRFPMPIHAPVAADGFSGQIALPGFVVGTGSRYYEPYACTFEGTVLMHVDRGHGIGFTGPPRSVAKVRDHFARVADRCGVNPNTVHSWHTGIHPGCAFPHPAESDWQRWSGAAFGNPRVLHFHACGEATPGAVSVNLIDPTVIVDGIEIWQGGILHPGRIPGGSAILGAYPCAAALFAEPSRDIGLPGFDRVRAEPAPVRP